MPRAPLLSLDSVPGARVETLADPFPVSHGGRLFVFAEVLGRREPTGFFKTIGVFEIDEGLAGARYLGDALPAGAGRYSYPYIIRDGGRYLLVPEVFVEFHGAPSRWIQVLQIYETAGHAFPFGWTKLHEQLLPGCEAPGDKVLLSQGDLWWLFCSDNAARRLMLYTSRDLRRWQLHPGGPVVARDDAPRAAGEPSLDERGARAWRLGGGVLVRAGRPALPLQHKHRSGSYGGAVTLLALGELTQRRGVASRDRSPLLAEDAGRPWMAHGAHHVALARHAG